MFAAFWFALAVLVRSARTIAGPLRLFVFAGCAALALGTLQGPVQALPSVNELLDRGGEGGDVIVNLHAQLNMLGGLMVVLIGLALSVLTRLGSPWPAGRARLALPAVWGGMLAYYAFGIAFAAAEAHQVSTGGTFAAAVSSFEPWAAIALVPAALAVLTGFWAYARAAWRMNGRQFELTRRALAAMPSLYTGRIPRRVQRRSPAALAGYELPLGLLGFPGVGWLFAGFPFVASILLLAGPALAWAVVPVAFSPYADGPLHNVGWKAELVYLPASAIVSAALLYRAHARRRSRLFGDPPRGRRRLRPGSYRTRVSVAIGTLALVLVSLPFVPALAGIGSSSVRYTYQPRLTPEVTGQFLSTPDGLVKLFSWSDPQSPYPADALRIHAGDLGALAVRAAAVDDPSGYTLFDLDRGGTVPLRVVASGPTALRLVLDRVPEPGRYAFAATHEGMFGGRDFAYITVVRPGESVTAISSHYEGSAPAVADTLLPLGATLVALLFSGLLLSSFFRRPAGQKVFWGLGFALFAAAAFAEAAAQRSGWSPALFRIYYLAGGVLAVACLGAGSAWLLLPPRARDVLAGALITAALGAAVTVLLAPVDERLLMATPSGRPPPNVALGGHAALWAVTLNIFGTIFLVGGSLYAIVRRRRVRANAWIACGAIIVALATGMSRAGNYSFVYAGELLGIAIMFAGFRFTGAPAKEARPSPTAVHLAPGARAR